MKGLNENNTFPSVLGDTGSERDLVTEEHRKAKISVFRVWFCVLVVEVFFDASVVGIA